MKNIAILTGGDTEEKVISYKSAKVVKEYLPAKRFNTYLIDIQKDKWTDMASGEAIDKNDFSLTTGGKKVKFDCAFAALHGSPLEDGKMQGYFDLLGIPYTCCNGYVSALTMNKHNTKMQVKPLKVPMAKSLLVRRGEKVDPKALVAALGLPMFVKPNSNGSSFGVTKVKNLEQVLPALEAVWPHDHEAVVEAFMPGREFSNGILRRKGKIVVFSPTEIIPETEFFDFAAKYEGKSKEVTPAEIPKHLTRQIQKQTKKIYEALGCKGAVRIDFILVGEKFHFLEVNTIPGISPASIIPQQARAHGWDLGKFFSILVEEALR